MNLGNALREAHASRGGRAADALMARTGGGVIDRHVREPHAEAAAAPRSRA